MRTSGAHEEHIRAEGIAAAVPGVLEAAVASGEGGLDVFVVVSRPGARLEVGAHIRRALSREMDVAVAGVHYPTALPRSPQGDLDRARLADPGWRASPEAATLFPTGDSRSEIPGTPGVRSYPPRAR